MKFNIASRIVAFTALIVLVLVGGSSIMSIHQFKAQRLESFTSRAYRTGRFIVEQVRQELHHGDAVKLAAELKKAVTDEDIAALAVTNAAGKVIAEAGRGLPPAPATDASPWYRAAYQEKAWTSRFDRERLIIVGPITLVHGRHIGSLQVEFPLARLNRSLGQNFRASLMRVLLSLCLGIVLAFWLAKHFSRPIEALAQTAQRIGAGDLSARSALQRGARRLRRRAHQAGQARLGWRRTRCRWSLAPGLRQPVKNRRRRDLFSAAKLAQSIARGRQLGESKSGGQNT